MKRVTLALFLLLAITGCGGGMNLAGTKLRLTAVNPIVGQAVFHLDCGPTGGDVSDPSSACSALGNDPRLVTSPQPFTCLGGPSSWFDMTISGRLGGKPVHQKFSTCWTPQMATLKKLGLASSLEGHVLQRRHGLVRPGIPRTFPAGALRPGDLLVCKALHRSVEMGIPDSVGPIGSVGSAGATLTGRRHADGSVTASCRESA
jgi:hypothetical protein